MKTLILNGSPRPNGDTVSLIKILTEKLTGEYKIVNCYSDDISPCTDCRRCRRKSGCAFDDKMNDIYEYIAACDNVVIASPVYFGELTGRTLNVASRFQTYFSARFFRGEKPALSPKKGAVILVGGGCGDVQRAKDTADCILRLINAKDIHPAVVSHDTDRTPAAEDEAAVDGVKKLAAFLNGE